MLELLLLAVGLAMDASAVAAASGLSHPHTPFRRGLRMAAVFGFFQGAMPCVGWLGGSRLAGWADRATPWIAFAILVFLGGRMIRGGLRNRDAEASEDVKEANSPFVLRSLLGLGIATSLDALAVGVTLPLLRIRLPICAIVIAGVTFLLSAASFQLGRRLAARGSSSRRNRLDPSRFEVVGGVVLVGVGAKLLLAHLLA